MKYYYVDYENVHEDGLKGIADLSTDCQVTIYWSQKAGKLSFNSHMAIIKSKATVEYVQVQSSQTNAMDKRIIQDLHKQTNSDKKSEYFIISKDNDYAEETNVMARKGLRICRSSDIASGNSILSQILNVKNSQKTSNSAKKSTVSDKEKKNQQIRSFLGKELKEYRDNLDDICNIIMRSKTKTQVHCELQKKFYNDDASYIYKTIQRFIQDMPGQ